MLSTAKTIFRKIDHQLSSVYEPEEAKSLAYIVLEEVTSLNKTDVLVDKPYALPQDQENKISGILARLLDHQPIQYILGKTTFYGLDLLVNQDVLIPRQETEELVDWIIKSHHEAFKLLDIGTGSGCIAISLAKGYPKGEVYAWDISPEALKMAKKNALSNQISVHLNQVDVLSTIPDETFDLIVSNPPYVLEQEQGAMRKNVLDHEPGTALFVPDQDPLIFYRVICKMTTHHLSDGGWLYFEINEAYGQEVVSLMEAYHFKNILVRKDLNGKDRMIRGQKP